MVEISTKYLDERSDDIFTVKAMNINDPFVTEEDKKTVLEMKDNYLVTETGDIAFKDKDGSWAYAAQSYKDATVDTSKFNAADVQKLADLTYLSQNTGVSSAELNAAKQAVGLDPSDTFNTMSKKSAILKAFGYTPGDNRDFYGSNQAQDVGAQILYERWQDAPTDEEIEAAGMDPTNVGIVNSNTANALYLQNAMAERGLTTDQTSARFRTDVRNKADLAQSYADTEKYVADNEYWKPRIQATGSYDAATLDMTEWDLIKKKAEETGVDKKGYTSAVGNVNLTGGTSQTGGNITGGGTPGVYQGPNFVSTPNISNITPVMSSGTYEATLPTYEAGLGKQKTQFECRAIDQAKMYQPQTQAEKEALAATDPNYTAPAFENVLYRNRFGMSQYIQHINGVPSQPIPPGYYKVENFTDQSQTQAGSAAQGGNKGGMIQSFNNGGLPEGVTIKRYGNRYGYADPFGNQIKFTDSAGGTSSTLESEEAALSAAQNVDYVKSALEPYNPYTGDLNPAMNYQPGGQIIQADGGYRIQYPGEGGATSQLFSTYGQAVAANQSGLSGLGLPDYQTYLTQQGVSTTNPGYDPAAYQSAYQSYISDPTTLANIQAQEAAANLVEQTGDINADQPTGQTQVTAEDLAQYQRDLAAQAYAAPGGAVAAAPVSYLDPNTYGSVIESTAGQALGTAPMVQEDQVAQIGSATQAIGPGYEGLKPMDYANMALEISTGLREYDPRFDTNGDGTVTSADALAIANGSFQVEQLESEKAYVQPEASQYTANQAYSDVSTATGEMTAATSDGPSKTIDAAQQTGSSLTGLTSATRDSIDVTAPDARTLETIDGQSELITGTGVDQSKVLSAFGEGEIKAASVQDELTGLMQQFEGGNTPAWAAGSMRSAMATLAARGLGASSMAGQAVIQAAMESALPIAQIDTANKQQVALFKAEQRAKFLQMDFDQAFQAKVMNAAKVSEIANMNFTAEQQIALENSKAANTMQLQNLSNEQALVMAEAAALSQMDMANLNNRQQAAVQNAQNFLQIDMANLANEQQTALFKQQSLVNSILSDQAAANAAAQFNSTSENQTNQFFANLAASVSQFNAAQMNAMKQFNADEVNSLLEFNAGLQNQREMFNAQNYLVVAQANAQWRQNLATINTAAANESNMDYAQTVNGLTAKTLDEIWQRERDLMDYSFTSSENAADRALSILLGDKQLSAIKQQIDSQEDQALGSLLTKVFFSSDFKSIFSPEEE